MGNSSGTYRTTTKNTMAAYDKLPPSARQALQDAVFCWATQPIPTRWRNGLPGYRNGKEVARTIAAIDKRALAKLKPNRHAGRDETMNETGFLINEAQMLLLVMLSENGNSDDARAEIIEIIKAWKRGRLLPKADAPTLQHLYGAFDPPPLRAVD